MQVRNLLAISDQEFLERGVKARQAAFERWQANPSNVAAELNYNHWLEWCCSFAQTMKGESPTCPCGEVAVTTIAKIPACAKCHGEYAAEGRKYLPIQQRTFYTSFIDRARAQGMASATNVTFEGY